MDNVNIETTLNYIEKLDKQLIEQIDNITFEYNGLSTEGQKLLQILSYSPKVMKPNREKIKNLKNIEMPQLSELGKLDFSKLDINPINTNNKKEIKDAINILIKSIIDDIIKNIDNNSNNNKDNKNGINKEKTNEEISNKNIKNENKINIKSNEIKIEDNFLYELKVFLFNKDDFITINITPQETIEIIKERIINKIIAEKDYEIEYSNEKDYELRTMEKVGDKFISKSFPFEDAKSLIDNNIRIISFVENKLYKVKSSKL